MQVAADVVGWIATVLTILMYAPQVIKVLRTKHTDGISRTMFTMISVGSIFWTFFGVLTHSWQVWATNGVILLLMIPIFYYLYIKNRYLFYAIAATLVTVTVITLVFLIVGVNNNQVAKVVIPIIAGLGTGFPFFPQVFKTIKEKNIKNIAVGSSLMSAVGNVFWVLYYILTMVAANAFLSDQLVAAIFSSFAVISATSMAVCYFKYKNYQPPVLA